MSSEEFFTRSPTSLSRSYAEYVKDPAPTVHEEEEHMTSGEIGLQHGHDLYPDEEVFTPFTPPPELFDDSDVLGGLFWDSLFDTLEAPPDSPLLTHPPLLTGFEDDFYFPPNFKEYMEGELKWSRLEITDHEPRGYCDLPSWRNRDSKGISWVFRSRQDDDLLPSYDNIITALIPDVSASPKVRDNIIYALKEMILNTILGNSLVQFWAPSRTSEGRTLLTTQHQPFALGKTYNKIDRQRLCEYRMMMTRGEYEFYADAESGEEQLGLPGRVFLYRSPESTPDVMDYSLREYPQLLDALECLIKGSWALPVFERSSQTCVGVLEIASLLNLPSVWHHKSFLGHMCDIFQEFGLQIFDRYKHREMQSRYKNKALTAAFQELDTVCQSVCKIHKLPLALTWVSCCSSSDLLRSQHQFGDGDYFDYSNLFDLMEVCRECYLRKGLVTGRILPSPNLLCCSDVKKFNIAEYPLVPYARRCELSGWFTMCLQSSCTGNEFYVLEFFLPTSCKYNENILTTISLILGTMQKNLKTFKLASGQELGEVLSVEVLNFQNDQKVRSIEMIKASRCIPSLEPKVGGVVLQLGQVDQSSVDAINNGMNVISEAQTDNLPGHVPLQNGEVAMQLDSSGQQSMDPSNNGATTCIPSLEQLGQLDQASMDAINNGMNVVSEAQINNLPSLEPLQNGEEAMQLDSADHQSMDLYNGQNVGTMEQNIIVVSSPEEGTRKLKDSSSRLKRIRRGYGIHRWPPRKINMVRKICWGYGFYRRLPRKINMVCHSRPWPLEDQEQIPKQPSDQASACDGNIKPASACDGNIKPASACDGNINPGLQDASMVTIKAKYENYTLKFKLPLLSRLEDLRQEVAKRLKNLGTGTYYVKYKDEVDELILIACDEDLQDCIHTCRSMEKSTIVLLLEPEQPIANLNPSD